MWLENCICFKGDFCQCNLARDPDSGKHRVANGQGWRHPDKLYSNMDDMKFVFEKHICAWPCRWECNCDCSQVKGNYLREIGNKHAMDEFMCVCHWFVLHCLYCNGPMDRRTVHEYVTYFVSMIPGRTSLLPRFGVESGADRWRRHEELEKVGEIRKW